MPSLIVVGKSRTERFDLDQAVTVIGRDAGVSVALSDFKVSRRHALLVRTSAGFFVKDLGSRNGMTVNQSKLPSRQQARLKNGDVLGIGQTTLIFKDIDALEDDDEGYEPTKTLDVPVVAPEPTPTDTGPVETDPPAAEAAPAKAAPAKTPPAKAAPPKAARPAAAPIRKAAAPRRPADAEAIPRALSPGDPSSGRIAQALGGQPAEVLLVQALERSERERAFYRNVALFMICVLVGTLVWLLTTALRSEPQTAALPAEVQGQAPAPVTRAPAAAAPLALADLDPSVFAGDVQPVFAAHCTRCHDTVGRGGDLLLAASDDPVTVEANMRAALRFVIAAEPERSPLLLAPLPSDQGGLPHGGHDVLALQDAAWKTLHAWVTTPLAPAEPVADARPATASEDAPPVAAITAPASVEVGQPVSLDGSASRDPEGGELYYRWSVEASPEGSQATLTGGQSPQATLVPDLSGRYEVVLLVHDGHASHSARASVRVVLPPSDPARREALQQAATRLLGAPLSDELAERLAGEPRAAVVDHFLAQPPLFERWWRAELDYLGLTGAAAPEGEPWASMPDRLQRKRFSVQDVLYALAVGTAWNTTYAGKEAYADAILTKFLGLDPAAEPAARAAAQRLYDGYPAELLGQSGEAQADLVRIALDDPSARGHLLRRSHQAATGQPIDGDSLQRALERLQQDPHAFFALRAEWALHGL